MKITLTFFRRRPYFAFSLLTLKTNTNLGSLDFQLNDSI